MGRRFVNLSLVSGFVSVSIMMEHGEEVKIYCRSEDINSRSSAWPMYDSNLTNPWVSHTVVVTVRVSTLLLYEHEIACNMCKEGMLNPFIETKQWLHHLILRVGKPGLYSGV